MILDQVHLKVWHLQQTIIVMFY